MRAVVAAGDGRVQVKDVPMPSVGDYDCLVKIRSCLFCNNTDRHIVERTLDLGVPYPCVLGHESLGRVVAVGAKVRGFAPGDWVVRPYAMYPDETLGELGSGWGGFAEFGKIRDFQSMVADAALAADAVPGFFKYMQRLPDGLAPERATMLSCLREICSATRQIPEVAGRSFLVAGAGVAGCLFAVFLKRAGAGQVAIAARRREQLDFAKANTPADQTVELDQLPSLGRRFDALVDTTGSAETLCGLLDHSLKPGGVCHSYAIYPGMGRPGFFEQFSRRAKFERLNPAEATAHEEVCALLLSGELDAANYITHSFPLDQAEAAWATVTGKKTMKTAILFDA